MDTVIIERANWASPARTRSTASPATPVRSSVSHGIASTSPPNCHVISRYRPGVGSKSGMTPRRRLSVRVRSGRA
ncbi:hypothetical protein AU194_17045 [Mycobacterium sp. GA-2829]|nr:hypothetical protein AU194_17045 [Mycobacterium sp. GA-2829]